MKSKDELGEVVIREDFNSIEIKLYPIYEEAYDGALKLILEILKSSGAFPEVYFEGLKIFNSSELFWLALKQKLFISMEIILLEEIR
jgi:hypothetical protein